MQLINKPLVCSSLAISLGIAAFFATQKISQDAMAPIVKACSSNADNNYNMSAFVETTGYHAYEKRLGGVFSCIMTQFLYELVAKAHYPTGLLAWGATVTIMLPVGVLVTVEAGRRGGARGLAHYPTLILFLAQLAGISVVFPLLWVPSYIFFGSTTEPSGCGPVSLGRARFALVQWIPGVAASVACFVMDPESYAWTLVAGALGGPLLSLTPLLAWRMKAPTNDAPFETTSYSTIAFAYSIVGAVSLVGWAYLVFTAFRYYALDFAAFGHDLVSNNYAVTFMVMDATVLYLGLVLYLLYAYSTCQEKNASFTGTISVLFEVLVQSLFFGPGASCAMWMAQLEMERCVVAQHEHQQQHNQATRAEHAGKKDK